MLPDASRYLPLKILLTNSYFYFQIFAIMADEIVVESNPEAADGDDISSGQPLPESEQPAMAAPASDSTSPASNMAANGRTQDGVPAGRGKVKPPRPNVGFSPMSMGVNYQIFNPYSYWPGQGHQIPMPPHPHVTMAAGPSWSTSPPVDMNTQGGASTTPGSFGW